MKTLEEKVIRAYEAAGSKLSYRFPMDHVVPDIDRCVCWAVGVVGGLWAWGLDRLIDGSGLTRLCFRIHTGACTTRTTCPSSSRCRSGTSRAGPGEKDNFMFENDKYI